MAKHVSVQLDTLSEENQMSDQESGINFKSSALVAVAVKRRPNTSNRSLKRVRRSTAKLSCLDIFTNGDSISVITLSAEGKLSELKQAIKGHNLTLAEVDQNSQTLLHHATMHEQQEVMLFLIDSGINLDTVDVNGNTALHLAAGNDSADACHILLANGANDSILNKKGHAAIHIAAQGMNKALHTLLDHPIDSAVVGLCRKTALHIICEYDNLEGMKIIDKKILAEKLSKDKNTNLKICAPDENGLTPIHLAARKNSHQVLDYLIQRCKVYGYTIDEVLGLLDEENSTPLHAAVDSCNTEVVQVLLKHGASPVNSKGNLIPPLHLACSQGRSHMVRLMVDQAGPKIISSTDQQQKTPLHHCSLSIHSSIIISFLIERGKEIININARDMRGRTALHNAVASANLAGTKELLSLGADPLVKDSKGLNVLHLALNSNRRAIVNALLELPCAAELIGDTCCKGYSAIHYAIHIEHGEVIPKMISALHTQFEVHKLQDEEGNNYLHLAAVKGNVRALRALLEVPEIHKLLNETNNAGLTPLHSAALNGHYRCIDLLLNNGAMFHKALNGETAFIIACRKGFTSCAKLLLQSHPCQITMSDNQGNSALHAAALSRVPSMITLMLEKNCKLTTNFDSLSFLDLIINSGDLNCMMAVINHDRWQECLDFSSPCCPNLFIGLIEQMPKAARAVLDRCHERVTTLDKFHPDYWESFNFKYLYAQKTKVSKIQHSLALMNPVVYPESDHNETTIKYKNNKSLQKASVSTELCVKKVNYGQNTMKVLEKMRQFKRQTLLTHPVVNAYVNTKWSRYGNIYFFAFFLFQLFVVSLLSIFVIVAPHPVKILESMNLTLADMNSTTEEELFGLRPVHQSIRGTVLSLNVPYFIFVIFNTIISIKRKALTVLFSSTVWINSIGTLSTFVFFSFPNPVYVWPIGAVSCFFAWFSLLLLLEHLSLPGTIVKMLFEVTKTVFFVLLVSMFLLFAFAFSFYILAGSLDEFDNVGYAFLSVFGFMLGELPYDKYVKLDVAGQLPFGGIMLVFILLLAILLSIVLANLLIGLAVGDIERVKLNAILQRKEIEIEFFAQLDASIPRKTLSQLSLSSYTVYPNKDRTICKIWRDSWKWIENQMESDEQNTSNTASISSCLSEIAELKLHVIELKETLQQMQEANAEFKKRYSNLSARSSISSFDLEPQILADSWH